MHKKYGMEVQSAMVGSVKRNCRFPCNAVGGGLRFCLRLLSEFEIARPLSMPQHTVFQFATMVSIVEFCN